MRRHRRILATPTRTLASAASGRVAVSGRVAAASRGLATSRYTGREGVWITTHVQTRGRLGRGWRTLHREEIALPFWMEDGSGERALVQPDGGELVGDLEELTGAPYASASDSNAGGPSGSTLAPLDPAAGEPRPATWGMLRDRPRTQRVVERIVGVGAEVYVVGPCRRDPGPPAHDGYRMIPRKHLVLYCGPTETEDLLVSTKPAYLATARLRRPFWLGIALTTAAVVGGITVEVGQWLSFW